MILVVFKTLPTGNVGNETNQCRHESKPCFNLPRQLIAHFFQQTTKRGFFGGYQSGSKLIPGVMAAAKEKKYKVG